MSMFEVLCFLFFFFFLSTFLPQGGGDSFSGVSIVGIIIFLGSLFVLPLQRTADSPLD